MRRIAIREATETSGNADVPKGHRNACFPGSAPHGNSSARVAGRQSPAALTARPLTVLVATMVAAVGSMALGYQLSVVNGNIETILFMLHVDSPSAMLKGLVSPIEPLFEHEDPVPLTFPCEHRLWAVCSQVLQLGASMA